MQPSLVSITREDIRVGFLVDKFDEDWVVVEASSVGGGEST